MTDVGYTKVMHRPEARTHVSLPFLRSDPPSRAAAPPVSGLMVAPRSRLRHRIAARLLAGRLDAALAAGANPEGDPSLSVRARRLTTRREREQLADALHRSRAEALSGGPRLRIPISRERVQQAEDELSLLAHRLASPGPVAARGVALARALLSDGAGPLYDKRSPGDLAALARRAADALLLDG